jgi:hypothetical protein
MVWWVAVGKGGRCSRGRGKHWWTVARAIGGGGEVVGR